MLHILLLILKIAGIILAVILGILLLALCTVLFVPFCYRGAARWDAGQKELRAQGRISWLLGLVEIRFIFRDGRASAKVRIAWRTLGGIRTEGRGDEPEAQEQKRPEEAERKDRQKEEEHEKEREKDQQGNEKADETKEAAPSPETAVANTEEKDEEKHAEKEPESGSQSEENVPRDEEEGTGPAEENSRLSQAAEKVCRIFRQIIKKIKCTFKSICDKINLIYEKKEQAADFLNDESHRKAFYIAKRQCVRLARSVLPRHFSLSTRFGFKDPYHTGQLLAGMAVVYPFLPGDVRVEPDFEARVFQGRTRMRGRLYMASLLFAAIQVLRHRAVRETIRDIRALFRAKA